MKYYFKCPKCKSNDKFMAPSEDSGGLGCLLFLLGGLLPALIYSSSVSHRVQCGNCGHIFRPPPLPNSPVSKLATWIFIVLITFVFFGFLMIMEPGFASIVPKYSWLAGFEEVIAEHAYIFAFGLVALALILIITIVFTSTISNSKFRRNLLKEYRTDIEEFPNNKNSANQSTHSITGSAGSE